jgi:hypothetical protein
MTRVFVAAVFLATNVVGPAMATCTGFGGSMSASAIATLLKPLVATPPPLPSGATYACYNNGSMRENNETLIGSATSGAVWDYKLGAPSAGNKDPSAQVGTYTISGTATGTITYTYAHTAPAYQICVTPSGSTYQFYNGSANIGVVISTSVSGC